MDYFLIKGSFHVVRYSPDGDSLMFEADNAKNWDLIQSEFQTLFQEKLTAGNGSVQLRLQGVDALETHYSQMATPTPAALRGKTFSQAEAPKPGKFEQPEFYGKLATGQLLSSLGVETVAWGPGGAWIKEITVGKGRSAKTYDAKNSDRIEGYIVVNDFDSKGRPISWVFGGKTPSRDGTQLTDSKLLRLLKKSANYQLIETGLVYPYFFMTLSAKLRQPLSQAVEKAVQEKKNIWSADSTLQGIPLKRLSQLTSDYLILPYLFRRLIKHQFKCLEDDYRAAVENKQPYKPDYEAFFPERFFDDSNPYIFLVGERDFQRLDKIVAITNKKMQLKTHPGNIVFLS